MPPIMITFFKPDNVTFTFYNESGDVSNALENMISFIMGEGDTVRRMYMGQLMKDIMKGQNCVEEIPRINKKCKISWFDSAQLASAEKDLDKWTQIDYRKMLEIGNSGIPHRNLFLRIEY